MKSTRVDSAPRLITSEGELRALVAEARRANQQVGLVPTMGALHAGHLSLAEAASRDCQLVIVTIFVNPTQFGPGEDFSRYPRTLEKDLALLADRGAQLVFAPATDVMYVAGHATYVEVEGPARRWEGEFRPGHFRGVATIVLKLFNLVQPDRAYFGQKDFQQALVVRRMIADFNLPIVLEVCPTVREPDGLALSSRNVYLSAAERERALAISRSLQAIKTAHAGGARDATKLIEQARETLRAAGLQIDYVAIADRQSLAPLERIDQPAVALIAARVGTTRLIDNELIG